jgi:hypothetical protein
MPSRTLDICDISTRIVPVQKAFSLRTRRSTKTDGPRIQAKVGEHLDAARAELRAFTLFPKQIWRQIWFQQPPGTTQQRDPAAHRRRRHLPRPHRLDPPRRCRAGRTARRMGRIPPLPRPGSPQQIPSRSEPTGRTGGHPRGTDRLNHYLEESHNDVIHHVRGLDRRLLSFPSSVGSQVPRHLPDCCVICAAQVRVRADRRDARIEISWAARHCAAVAALTARLSPRRPADPQQTGWRTGFWNAEIGPSLSSVQPSTTT